jgi:Zn-dependent protease with chaperone function
MTELGRWLISTGVVLIVIGLIVLAAGRLPWLGRLPGDILIERDNLTIFIPLGTMLVVSLVLTVIANVIARWWR